MSTPEKDLEAPHWQTAPMNSRYTKTVEPPHATHISPSQALRILGRVKESNAILYPMMQSFEDGRFQGRASGRLTYDWMDGRVTLMAMKACSWTTI